MLFRLLRVPLKARRIVLYIAAVGAYILSTAVLNVDPLDVRRLAFIVIISLINQSLGATIVLRANEKMTTNR